jgi:nitric-oxide synthase
MDLTRVATGLGVGVMCPAAPPGRTGGGAGTAQDGDTGTARGGGADTAQDADTAVAPDDAGTTQGRTRDERQEPTRPVDMDAVAEFIRLHRRECTEAGEVGRRLREIRREVERTGTYQHTSAELVFGARVAWRNSCRCIGRLYWQSLQVRDRRDLNTAADIAAECAIHLRTATNGGRIRPTITVFAPDTPGRPGPRIWNEQIVRYAGYQRPDGTVHGDPRNADLTGLALSLGWHGAGSRFDVLPLVISTAGGPPGIFGLPSAGVLEVPLSHPRFDWFAELGLRWHAVPVITDMCLEIGGICYPAAPFNGWYMGTEIGARNLADCDRYNQLPEIAARMGLDLSSDRSLWRDRAMVELNVAVLHSFDTAGVTITDHHTESRRFLTHLAREERARRVCPADWSWIVPPISGSTTEVFHRYYDEADLRPNYVRHDRDLPGLHPGPG